MGRLFKTKTGELSVKVDTLRLLSARRMRGSSDDRMAPVPE